MVLSLKETSDVRVQQNSNMFIRNVFVTVIRLAHENAPTGTII